MIHMAHRMPRGVVPLYYIQAFSTFSYAILYASLSLYLTRQLGLSSLISNSIVGIFLVFNYALHLLGGVIGGNYLSNRVVFLITTVLKSVGILFLVWPQISMLYAGLSLFLVGCGLNTTCYNSLLTQRFEAEDNRRDKAFFWSYSAMNIGFFAGYIISGFYDYSNDYTQLFYISALINMLTAVCLMYCWQDFPDRDTAISLLKNDSKKHSKNFQGIALMLLLIPSLIFCFNFAQLSNYLVMALSIAMFFVILFIGFKQKKIADQQKIMAYLILTVMSIVFWMIYFTGPMGVTLFVKNNVDKHFLSYEIPTQWILNINALLIIFGAPLMSFVLNKYQARGFNVSVTTQFVWAFLILALSFLFLACAVVFANDQGYSGLSWVVLHFIAQSIAELLIGPVGYAMIGRIAPVKLQGLLMGTWMMVSGISASLAQLFSNAMVKTESLVPSVTNADYVHVFYQLSLWGFLGGVFLYLLSGKIRSLIDGSEQQQSTTLEVANGT